MSDVVVTVPVKQWSRWLEEGDLPGDRPTGRQYSFSVPTAPRDLFRGDRVYIVCNGKLRGYAPLVSIVQGTIVPRGIRMTGWLLIREGSAVAVTIPRVFVPRRGFVYRWWPRDMETPFPDWKTL